jgi:hypothetical protein
MLYTKLIKILNLHLLINFVTLSLQLAACADLQEAVNTIQWLK